jgi:hypothetical protein
VAQREAARRSQRGDLTKSLNMYTSITVILQLIDYIISGIADGQLYIKGWKGDEIEELEVRTFRHFQRTKVETNFGSSLPFILQVTTLYLLALMHIPRMNRRN